jgi:hypothetical protein
MFVDRSASKKSLASDPLTESINLIDALAHIIQDCPACLAKLKELKLNKNDTGVTSSSLPSG